MNLILFTILSVSFCILGCASYRYSYKPADISGKEPLRASISSIAIGDEPSNSTVHIRWLGISKVAGSPNRVLLIGLSFDNKSKVDWKFKFPNQKISFYVGQSYVEVNSSTPPKSDSVISLIPGPTRTIALAFPIPGDSFIFENLLEFNFTGEILIKEKSAEFRRKFLRVRATPEDYQINQDFIREYHENKVINRTNPFEVFRYPPKLQ